MNKAANTLSTPRAASPSLLRIYWLDMRNEILRAFRTPIFALPTLLFPLVFYIMFGVLLNRGSGAAGSYLLATYGVFGVMGAALFGFGASVAMERDNGLLRLRRAMPSPPGAYLIAKLGMAMLFAILISVSLLALAVGLAAVQITPTQALLLVVVNVMGALPFAALGLYIGSLASGNGAVAIINLVFLPMAFLSGLWLPLAMLPGWLATAAPLWPAYHLAQIALKVIGQDAGQPLWLHIGVLLVFSAVFATLARARLARAE
ncbi:MAG: ABC transporter permease [Pseudomonadota bacterium]|nr:ABC transporter permease [Pseudomonadota bacterium]